MRTILNTIGNWAFDICVVIILIILLRSSGRSETALCALRADLNERVTRSQQYLIDLDLGKRQPIPGISRADIVTSIQNQQNTIQALQGLHCG